MLESKSTSKENSPQLHLEAASDLARRRTQGVRDAKNLVQDAHLRESVSSTVSMATMRSDGCSRLGATPGPPNGNDGARWPTAPP